MLVGSNKKKLERFAFINGFQFRFRSVCGILRFPKSKADTCAYMMELWSSLGSVRGSDPSFLDLDSTGAGFGAILVDVGVVRVVLGLQDLPLFAAVIDQIVDDSGGSLALLLTALGTVRLQGFRQELLQFFGVRRASALVQQALVVVCEQPVGLEDLVDVDSVVLGGVLVLGGNGHD